MGGEGGRWEGRGRERTGGEGQRVQQDAMTHSTLLSGSQALDELSPLSVTPALNSSMLTSAKATLFCEGTKPPTRSLVTPPPSDMSDMSVISHLRTDVARGGKVARFGGIVAGMCCEGL